MIRSTSITLFAATLATSAKADITEYYRYEFGIRVLSNTVASNAIGGELATLGIGTEGIIRFDVNPDASIYQSDASDNFQPYQVLDVGLQIGSITSGATPGLYPSGPSFLQGIWVENDSLIGGGQFSDSIAMIPGFANPEVGFSAFGIAQRVPASQLSTLLSSIDLPLSIDTSLITTFVDFSITSPRDNVSRVSFDVYDVTITVIPTPASATIFALAALGAARRRR